MRFGAHVSVSRGPAKTVEFALERGCEAVQIFSSNPRGWALSKVAPAEDAELRSRLRDAGIHPVLLHTPYLVNIAAPDTEVYTRSVATLVHAAERARRLEGYVVVHAGRDSTGPREQAVERAAAAVLTALKLVPASRILIEPTAGGRGSVASRMEETGELLASIDDERAGVCLDTCHAHACGYELAKPKGARAWVGEVEQHIGVERVVALHANDSRDPCGSCRDRHWHLGQGEIGEAGLRAVLTDRRLGHAAVIIETPGRTAEDKENLARARGFAGRRR